MDLKLRDNKEVKQLFQDITHVVGPFNEWPYMLQKYFWIPPPHQMRPIVVAFFYINGLNPQVHLLLCCYLHNMYTLFFRGMLLVLCIKNGLSLITRQLIIILQHVIPLLSMIFKDKLNSVSSEVVRVMFQIPHPSFLVSLISPSIFIVLRNIIALLPLLFDELFNG